ncbi:MAG: serine/threonine-protein phosphatase [Spirochaetaceae bacterium]|nr:serine/threonine-protein phosphatase [Spirochaetaceae bacterium]
MGLMPFILFDNNYKFSLPIGIVAGLTFIGYENLEVASKYELSPIVMQALRYMNMGITIGTIITMLVVFTLVVYRIENNLQNKNESLNKEIKLASVVQQNFFRLEPIDFDDWEVAYYNQPMAAVSGDLFDIYHRQNNIDGIGIFDISGHGLASGLVTMLVKNIIHQEFYKITDTDLAEILSRINTRIIQEKADIENYLTGILVRIGSDKIELVNAGHPFPILYKSKQKECFFVERLTSSIGVIGMSGMTASYKSQFVRMDPGDELILYTDGITDMENDKKITFGKDNLIASIKKNVNATVKQQILNISKDILNFKASVPSNDDVTMMILRRKA